MWPFTPISFTARASIRHSDVSEIRPPILRRARFTLAAAKAVQFPADEGIEVGFAGRSNAGKSSAINCITGQKSLARTSKTPGRTQQIVFFDLDEHRRLVDLPGYGYAKVPPNLKMQWQNLMEGYFQNRHALRGLVLLMDIRHPLKEFDEIMLDWCEATQTPVHVLLTKADKLSRGAAAKQLQLVRKQTKARKMEMDIQTFSSLKADGLTDVLKKLEHWFELND